MYTLKSVSSVIFLFSVFSLVPASSGFLSQSKTLRVVLDQRGPCCEHTVCVTVISMKLRCQGDGSASADVLTDQAFDEQLQQCLGKQVNTQ